MRGSRYHQTPARPRTCPSRKKSFVVMQEKNDGIQTALFQRGGDSLKFTNPADHPLNPEFEEQSTTLVREYVGDGVFSWRFTTRLNPTPTTTPRTRRPWR